MKHSSENKELMQIQPSIRKKYDDLKKIISRVGSVVVSFSGGVDSTFLLKVCRDVLKSDVIAVTATSETFPDRELEHAKELAKSISVQHIIIKSEELNLPGFSDNPPNRCYMCKKELFSRLKKFSDEHRIDWVFDGSNADDINDFRPGRVAARELGIRSPLEEAELCKTEIRILSEMLGLSTWDKPSFACLSSRFPYHSKITRSALRKVEQAEDYLWQIGMRVFRVRHHDTIARLELGEKEMRQLWRNDYKNRIVNYFLSIGYKYITLDLEGYRTGSMNVVFSDIELFNGDTSILD